MRLRPMTAIRRTAAARLAEGLGAGTEEPTARDLVLRGQREPRSEVLRRGPARHVGPNLGDELEGRVGRDAIDLRQIDASGQVMEGRANLEARFVVTRLLVTRGSGKGVAGVARRAVSVRTCVSITWSQAASCV